MKLHSDLPVYKATYDLLLAIFQFSKDFSKAYKYTVGESLKKEAINLIIGIFKATTVRDKAKVIEKGREHIEVIA